MTTKEILEYLEKRWQIVKQVEEAAQNLERIKKQQPSQKNLYKRRMIILASLGIYMILLYFMSFPRMISYGFIGFLFYTILNMVIIAGILYLAYYFWKRKKEIIVQSNADYNDALKRAETDFYSLYNSTEYIQGAKSFPSEYYNSESLARLYKLVSLVHHVVSLIHLRLRLAILRKQPRTHIRLLKIQKQFEESQQELQPEHVKLLGLQRIYWIK